MEPREEEDASTAPTWSWWELDVFAPAVEFEGLPVRVWRANPRVLRELRRVVLPGIGEPAYEQGARVEVCETRASDAPAPLWAEIVPATRTVYLVYRSIDPDVSVWEVRCTAKAIEFQARRDPVQWGALPPPDQPNPWVVPALQFTGPVQSVDSPPPANQLELLDYEDPMVDESTAVYPSTMRERECAQMMEHWKALNLDWLRHMAMPVSDESDTVEMEEDDEMERDEGERRGATGKAQKTHKRRRIDAVVAGRPCTMHVVDGRDGDSTTVVRLPFIACAGARLPVLLPNGNEAVLRCHGGYNAALAMPNSR